MNEVLTDKDIKDLLLQIKVKYGHMFEDDENMAMTKAIASFEDE